MFTVCGKYSKDASSMAPPSDVEFLRPPREDRVDDGLDVTEKSPECDTYRLCCSQTIKMQEVET